MIDKTKRIEKEQAKAKTKKRIYVEVDPENYLLASCTKKDISEN